MNSSYDYDVIIVGAGPAGLTAGIYAVRRGLKTLILEKKFVGGTMAEAPLIENYPGLQRALSGLELANRMEIQAKKFGVQIISPENAVQLRVAEKKTVKTNKNTYGSRTVILSLGAEYRRLGVPGEIEFHGKGVSYCATCDGPFFKGRKVLVVGGGNSAATTAIYLSTLASDVKVVHRRDTLRADDLLMKELWSQKIGIILNTIVKEIAGNTMVRNATLEDVRTGERRSVDVEGVFVQIGEVPCSRIAKDAGVITDEAGYIIVDSRQRTNLEGVYAAGDVTNCPVKQVGTAVGQAIIAAEEAFLYVKKPYYYS